MARKIAIGSVVCNVVLIIALVVCVRVGEANRRAAMIGDECHIEIHEASLSALESGHPKDVSTAKDILRTIIDAGRRNAELRREAGLLD